MDRRSRRAHRRPSTCRRLIDSAPPALPVMRQACRRLRCRRGNTDFTGTMRVRRTASWLDRFSDSWVTSMSSRFDRCSTMALPIWRASRAASTSRRLQVCSSLYWSISSESNSGSRRPRLSAVLRSFTSTSSSSWPPSCCRRSNCICMARASLAVRSRRWWICPVRMMVSPTSLSSSSTNSAGTRSIGVTVPSLSARRTVDVSPLPLWTSGAGAAR